MAADLDDGNGGGERQFGAQHIVGQWRGQDFQDLVAGRERAADGGGGGGERGDAGDDGDSRLGGDAADQIHGGAIKQRVALAEPGDVATGVEVAEDGCGGCVIGGLRRGRARRTSGWRPAGGWRRG